MSNCYAALQIKNNGSFDLELVDVSFTDTSNVEGIIEYILNVLKIQTFTLYFTDLDYDHFKQLMNEIFEDYEVDYRFL